MATAWSHLPNAKYIDQVLASVKAHPEKWPSAWRKIYPNGTTAVWRAAWGAALSAALDAALDAAWYAGLDAARRSTWDAITALIAYDDCAYMLESEVGELKILAAFGDPKAILLLPACIVFTEVTVDKCPEDIV